MKIAILVIATSGTCTYSWNNRNFQMCMKNKKKLSFQFCGKDLFPVHFFLYPIKCGYIFMLHIYMKVDYFEWIEFVYVNIWWRRRSICTRKAHWSNFVNWTVVWFSSLPSNDLQYLQLKCINTHFRIIYLKINSE